MLTEIFCFIVPKKTKIEVGGKMKLKIWAKTFFSIYRCLSSLAKSIDNYVEIRANSCFHSTLSRLTLCQTERVFNDITTLINKKINLINIKALTEKLLLNLPEKYARFLVLKYIDGLTFEKTAECLGFTSRTAMRWNISVLNRCSNILRSWGYTNEKLLDFVGREHWIVNLFNKLLIEENQHSTKIAFFVLINEAEKEYKKYMI